MAGRIGVDHRRLSATSRRRAAGALGDLVLTLLLVLMLPVVLVVGAPLVFLAWVIVVIAQRDRGSHARPKTPVRLSGRWRLISTTAMSARSSPMTAIRGKSSTGPQDYPALAVWDELA